jgi:RND family efflux transporter MFP subunit
MNDQLSNDLHSLRIARGEPPKRKSLWTYVVVLGTLAGIGFGVRSYALPYAKANFVATEVRLTEVAVISPSQAQIDLTSTGYVVPQTVAKVGAKIVGRVLKSNVHEWDKVKANQVLFLLDGTDQRSAIASAQAKALAARARAQAARANVAEVKQQWEREKRLVQSGAVSSSTAEDLGARVGALNEAAKAADAEANAVQAEVSTLKTNLGDLSVKSPIDGVASTKPVEMGDVIRPDQTLVEISDLTTLLVEADVAETRISLVHTDGPCEITLDAFPGKRYRGQVVDVSPVLDRSKATAKVKVKFIDPADTARGQMAARVNFLTKELGAEQLKEIAKKVIPATALTERMGKKVVFTFEGGKAHMVPVTLGPALGTGFEVVEGPSPGTKLINTPSPTLADGQNVREEGK